MCIKVIPVEDADHDGIGKSGKLRLNLGCGMRPLKGHINIDKHDLPGVDIVLDLEKGMLPFETGSIDEVRAEHVLEHITNYIPLLEEIHRVLRPGSRFFVVSPYYKYEGSYRDPTHTRFFTEHSFDYFSDGVNFSYYTHARFRVLDVERRVRFLSSVRSFQKKIIISIPDFVRPILNMFLWNVYTEIRYDMRAIK